MDAAISNVCVLPRLRRIEWVSGNRSSLVKWSNQNTGSSVYHEIELQNPVANAEIANQAQDGKAYYAMASVRVPAHARLRYSF